jgi:hypothetical protein
MSLHGAEELDNNLGAWPDQNLALSSLFSVVDALQRIVENRCLDHIDGKRSTSLGRKARFSGRRAQGLEVSTHERY